VRIDDSRPEDTRPASSNSRPRDDPLPGGVGGPTVSQIATLGVGVLESPDEEPRGHRWSRPSRDS